MGTEEVDKVRVRTIRTTPENNVWDVEHATDFSSACEMNKIHQPLWAQALFALSIKIWVSCWYSDLPHIPREVDGVLPGIPDSAPVLAMRINLCPRSFA